MVQKPPYSSNINLLDSGTPVGENNSYGKGVEPEVQSNIYLVRQVFAGCEVVEINTKRYAVFINSQTYETIPKAVCATYHSCYSLMLRQSG